MCAVVRLVWVQKEDFSSTVKGDVWCSGHFSNDGLVGLRLY